MLERQAAAAVVVALLAGPVRAQPAGDATQAPPSAAAQPAGAPASAPVPGSPQTPPPTSPESPTAEAPPAAPAPGVAAAAGQGAAAVDPALIEAASLQPGDLKAQSAPFLVKLATLLDRAHNSPGAIDGRAGRNLAQALSAYEVMHGLQGGLTPQVVAALEKGETGPIVGAYEIADKDEAGPFIGHLPSDFYAQSKLRHMGYTTPEQELAERFHMSRALLEALNPGADFTQAGTKLAVLQIHQGGLGAHVARIVVDKRADQVRAFDASGKLVASFPSTIGSTEHPAPSGDYAVAYVRFDPVYVYDPRVLHWGPRNRGRFTIKPGPNNPTGVVWIGLTKPTYGIHGSPNAELIGKSASHGCVRLTNWDAWDLGNAVTKGVKVDFVDSAMTAT